MRLEPHLLIIVLCAHGGDHSCMRSCCAGCSCRDGVSGDGNDRVVMHNPQ